jgi:hypothetical protein
MGYPATSFHPIRASRNGGLSLGRLSARAFPRRKTCSQSRAKSADSELFPTSTPFCCPIATPMTLRQHGWESLNAASRRPSQSSSIRQGGEQWAYGCPGKCPGRPRFGAGNKSLAHPGVPLSHQNRDSGPTIEQPGIPNEAAYLLGSVALSADLKCAFHEPRPPEPIVVFPPVVAPERLPLRRSGRADLIRDRETPVPVAHLQTGHAWRLLLVHVAKLVEF